MQAILLPQFCLHGYSYFDKEWLRTNTGEEGILSLYFKKKKKRGEGSYTVRVFFQGLMASDGLNKMAPVPFIDLVIHQLCVETAEGTGGQEGAYD